MSFKLRVGVCALFLVPSLVGCASSSAGKVAAPSEEEMMAKWMAYATPGSGHEALAGKVVAAPGPGDYESFFNPNAVVEYYSR